MTTSSLTAYAFQQAVTTKSPSTWVGTWPGWNDYRIVACNWTSVQPSPASFTTTPTGCRIINNRPMVTAVTLGSHITPTTTEISNGGVVVLIASVGSPGSNFIYSEWVPLIAPGITVSPAGALSLTEGGSGTYNVKLATNPSGDVRVQVASNNTAVTVNKATGTAGASQNLSFTKTNWNTNQAITVMAVEDANKVDESATLTYSIVPANTEPDYDGATSVTRTVNVADNDKAGILTGTVSGQATEAGGSATFTVKLGLKPPTADVTVAVSSGVTAEGTVSPSSLTFTTTNWNATQTVTVTGKDDDVDDGNPSYDITLAASSGDTDYNGLSETVSVTTTDDDTAGITTGEVSGQATEAGGTATFTVELDSEPTADVTVAVSSGVTTEGTVSPSSLTFTSGDWDTTQEVTVTGKDDDVADGDSSYDITLVASSPGDSVYNSLGGVTVSVTTTDDDTAGASVTPQRSLRSTTEDNAGTVQLGVALSSKPAANVTVTVTSSDTTEGIVKAAEDDPDPTLTFTPTDWSTAQTVTVTGVDDEDVDGNVEYNIKLAFASTDTDYLNLSADIPFTNLDDDLSILSISGGGEVTEGDSGSSVQAVFTVSLAPARRQEVSVSYATADGTAEAGSDYAAASGTVTFSPGEISKTVAVTVNGDDEAEANETFSVTLTAGSNGQVDSRNSSAEAVIVNDDEKTVDAGMSGEFSVGDTTVTVDSTLPADTGLEVILPSELESGGAVIEELTVTLGPTDAEIDAERFGYTGTDADHVLVDIDVSPVPDGAVRICLPVTEGLRRAAGEQRLYLIRFSGGSWKELSSTTEGDKVCADVNGFSPFALVYRTDYVKRRFGEVNRAILPELSRAMTASALEAITGRIDDAMAGGTTTAFNVPSPSGEAEYGEPGLRLGELENGETLSLLDSVDGSYFSVSPAGSYDSAVGGTALAAAERGEEDSAPGAGDVSAPRSGGLGMWISGDYRNLSGKSGGLVDWDGRLVSGHLGADYRFGQSFLAGVATSWSQGSFDYTGRGERTRVSGDYGSRMNSFHPYLGLSLSRRLGVWAAGGWGFGEIRIDDGEVSGRRKASTRLGTLATGANLRLLGGGATALSLKGEAWISRMKVKDNGGRIEGLRVGTNRLRATLEGSHALAFGSGSSLVPSVEFGIRRDGGDGETGVGGELGGGIAYASSFGLAVEARGRALVFHQGDTGEWGVGGSVRFDPGEDGRGLSMSVLPSYGNSASGVQGLWENETAEGGSSGSERELGLETEVGYGFAAPGDRGLLTPYGAFGRTGGDGRSYGVGSRFSMGGTFDIALEGRRRELSAGEAEHGLTLQGRLNW